MPSVAWRAFRENAHDIERLMEIHGILGGSSKGRRFNLEVLNKSAIVLITAIWEAYCEDIASEALRHIVDNVPNAEDLPVELKKRIANELKGENHDLAIWKIADGKWKNLLLSRLDELREERNRKLNTPKSSQIIELFKTAIGLEDVSTAWTWGKMKSSGAREKLDRYVTLRGSIAHRGNVGGSCTKAHVQDYYGHIRFLVSKTGGRVNGHARRITGKPLYES